jgi:hypothetical protein
VLELVDTQATLATVLASSRALDALAPAGAYRCRVAADESMFVREPGAAEPLLRDSRSVLAGDPDAVVLDATDGWTILTLAGAEARTAFGYLSAVHLSDGFSQGDVQRLPARIVCEPARVHLFVPAMVSEYLRGLILSSCVTLGIRERTEPEAWSAVGGSP